MQGKRGHGCLNLYGVVNCAKIWLFQFKFGYSDIYVIIFTGTLTVSEAYWPAKYVIFLNA
jgi:hypothetical protein